MSDKTNCGEGETADDADELGDADEDENADCRGERCSSEKWKALQKKTSKIKPSYLRLRLVSSLAFTDVAGLLVSLYLWLFINTSKT